MTAKEFNDAEKNGPRAELRLLLLRQMRCKTDPIEARRVSIEAFLSPFPFAQPDSLLRAGNDPLSQGVLGGSPWPQGSGPDGAGAGPAWFPRVRPARTGDLSLERTRGLSISEGVSSSSTESHCSAQRCDQVPQFCIWNISRASVQEIRNEKSFTKRHTLSCQNYRGPRTRLLNRQGEDAGLQIAASCPVPSVLSPRSSPCSTT